MVVPWVDEYKRHVVSGIQCLNPEAFKIDGTQLYHQHQLKTEALKKVCLIQLDSLDKRALLELILFGNDEASQEMDKHRQMTTAHVDTENFMAIARHFYVSTVWMYQTRRKVPPSVLSFATMEFTKLSRKKILSCIEVPARRGNFTEITLIGGLNGLEWLKKHNRRRFEYPVVGKPDFTSWDINMIALRHKVNEITSDNPIDIVQGSTMEENIVESQRSFFKAVLSFLESEISKKDPNRVGREDIIKGLAYWLYQWMEENGRSGKKTAKINYATMSSLLPDQLEITPNVLSKKVSEIALDMQKHPDKWTFTDAANDDEKAMINRGLGKDAQ